MRGLYIYAVLDEAPAAALGTGVLGEPLRAVSCGTLLAVAGEIGEAPAPSLTALREHDAVIRRLADAAPAVLPARFGSVVADDAALRALILPRAATLGERLAHVRGRAQMTLRAYGHAEPTASASRTSGAAYLRDRRRTHDPRHALPALLPRLAALEPFVLDQRFEAHGTPPLLATVHHLVDRVRVHAYLDAAAAAKDGIGLRVTVSGPWAPYAFAGELPA